MKKSEQTYTEVTAIAAIFVSILIAFLLSCGCGTKYQAKRCQKLQCCKDSTYIKIKDSTYLVAVPFTVNSDTAWMQLQFECDSLNQVYIKNSDYYRGLYVQLKKDFDAGKLTIYSYLPAIHDTVYKAVTQKDSTMATTKTIIKNELNKYQRTIFTFGWVFIGLLILLIIYGVYKLVKKFV